MSHFKICQALIITLMLAGTTKGALVEYEFTSNEGFSGLFTLDTDEQIPDGGDFRYELPSGIPLFDFSHPLNAANDFNQDDGGNDCCMEATTDGAGNLLILAIDVDDVAGTSSNSFVFGELDFVAGTGQIDNAPFLAVTGLEWSFVTADANAVPEPATATLVLLGLGGLMMRRRRQA